MVDKRRTRKLNDADAGQGPVLYWMNRSQRAHDNWALLYAQEVAKERGVGLMVVFSMFAVPGRSNVRMYDFMVGGLKEVQETLEKKNVTFVLLEGRAEETLPDFIEKESVGELVVDFSPLRGPRKTRSTLARQLSCRVTEVDAHNTVPCWEASDKKEFAAYTFRPKIHKKYKEFSGELPALQKHPHTHRLQTKVSNDWEKAVSKLELDDSVKPVDWITPGYKAAMKQLEDFMSNKLSSYDTDRNDPNKDALSCMSPYLHFGQISAGRVLSEIDSKRGIQMDAKNAYIEELLVRGELSENFCFYTEDYDKVSGAHEWAQKTIEEHKNDKREYLYTKKEFEEAKTHDELWNAMQVQMVTEGKMHGWCRMYWAKKILEWTKSNQEAIDIALYLNDKYELDGFDANGVVGVMWSICGVHDRAWNERDVFGKIRYMNFAGAKRKFDVQAYIDRYDNQETLFN